MKWTELRVLSCLPSGRLPLPLPATPLCSEACTQQTLRSAPGCPSPTSAQSHQPASHPLSSPTSLFASILDGFTHASLFSRDRHLLFPTCHIHRPPQPCLSPPHCSQGSRTGRVVTAAPGMAAAAAAAAMTGNQSLTVISSAGANSSFKY